ncbi:OmpA family protein [Acinetobacter sp. GSS19]|uniref:OmpA family protein n=1 Tax=Acinetobacter sp. GSS19 TaxID=3020716 RepID=UPI002360817A|nr:OmpA family protein [Acinetobacter sp. GSS19]
MNIKKTALIAAVVLSAIGCTSTPKKLPLERWTTFKPVTAIDADTSKLPVDRALVVFIREPGQISGPAVNVFIDGEYLTSLQDGGYKITSVCAAYGNIVANFTDPKADYYNIRRQKNVQTFKPGSVNFIKFIPGTNGQIQLQHLDEQTTRDLMPKYLEQINTISRVDQKKVCPQVVKQRVPVPYKKYTLQTNALFAFGKSGINDILQKGREEVYAVAQDIVKDGDHIMHVMVVGHTDPEGTNEYNEQLSIHRAETVRSLLMSSGIQNKTINIEGRGETEPLISDCRARFPKNKVARDKCNLPNRRVEVISYGVKPE